MVIFVMMLLAFNDLVVIDKRKRVMNRFTPKNPHEVLRPAKYNPSFPKVDTEEFGFFGI